jgi:hypothetical protein
MPPDDCPPAETTQRSSRHWRIDEATPDLALDEASVLPELVDRLDREVTKQGVNVIEEYGALLAQERDDTTQPLVEQYLQGRLKQHLKHLDDVTDEGIHRMINPAGSGEETGDEEK